MGNDYENLGGGVPSQTLDKGATDLPSTPEELQGKSPEEVAKYFDNAKKAIAEATKRNQEAAEARRNLEMEREEVDRRRQELLDKEQSFYGQLNNWKPPPPTTTQTAVPDYATDPYAAFKYSQDKIVSLEQKLEQKEKAWEEKYGKLEGDLKATQAETAFNDFFKDEIKPKYPSIKKSDINAYFSERPTLKADDRTVLRACEEIQGAKDAETEARYQDYLKRKEADAKAAQTAGGGSPMQFEKNDEFLKLNEGDQIEQLKRDAKKMMKDLGV